jgi:ferric-dicitrate binding protein FerR (iron transport regulator)
MTRKDNDSSIDADDTVARLLELGGARPDVPADVEARVYGNVRDAWAAATRPDPARVYERVHGRWRSDQRRRRAIRWALPAALAATVALAVVLVMPGREIGVAPAVVATVARTVGDGLPAAGEALHVGDIVQTGPGQGLSFVVDGSTSIRLDESTAVEILGSRSYRMTSGRLYADTGDLIYHGNSLKIETPFGVVRDIGTQFSIDARAQAQSIAVREGRVDLIADSGTHTAIAGERLHVDGAIVEVSDIDSFGDDWSWTGALAPAFDIENKSLYDFLGWASRETGRELVFDDDTLRLAAMRTDLHGSIENLEPAEALEVVLPTTRFDYVVEEARIVVTTRR